MIWQCGRSLMAVLDIHTVIIISTISYIGNNKFYAWMNNINMACINMNGETQQILYYIIQNLYH